MRIFDLLPNDRAKIKAVAGLLVAGFQHLSPEAWPDEASALTEVQESFGAGKISRVAVDDQGVVRGWVAATASYEGRAWELHPLVVDVRLQGRGIGRGLVTDLEMEVATRGGITLFLWTDDESGLTSLGERELYPGVSEHLATVTSSAPHPLGFYRRLGFKVAGVLPDANGLGKPDILMVKRVKAN